jgi:hypothetical protein
VFRQEFGGAGLFYFQRKGRTMRNLIVISSLIAFVTLVSPDNARGDEVIVELRFGTMDAFGNRR